MCFLVPTKLFNHKVYGAQQGKALPQLVPERQPKIALNPVRRQRHGSLKLHTIDTIFDLMDRLFLQSCSNSQETCLNNCVIKAWRLRGEGFTKETGATHAALSSL